MNLFQCIKKLLIMERDAASLYKIISETTSSEIAEIAIAFKKEEELHGKKLKDICSQLSEKELLSELELSCIDKFLVEGSLGKEKEISFNTRKELFTFALKGEKESIELYEGLKECFKDNEIVYNTMISLIEEEKKHMYAILKMLHEM